MSPSPCQLTSPTSTSSPGNEIRHGCNSFVIKVSSQKTPFARLSFVALWRYGKISFLLCSVPFLLQLAAGRLADCCACHLRANVFFAVRWDNLGVTAILIASSALVGLAPCALGLEPPFAS